MKKTFIPLFVGLLCWTGAHAKIIQVLVGDDLQAKINSASSGDEVRVHAGTFTGNFSFKDGVNVSGGWDATFENQTDYASILDANKSGRPVTSASLTRPTVWSNFKLTNGNLDDGGGGAQIRFNARLDHCLIEGNTTGGSNKGGGGVHLLNGGQIYNCIIRNNTATGDAGGVRISQYNYTGALDCKVINCVIANNTATNRCGGIQVEVDADIIGNTIVGNNQKTDESNKESCCGLNCAKSSSVSSGYYLANNIIWGNKHKGTVNSAQIFYVSRYPEAQRINNAVYNQSTGTGSINLSADDPGFVDKDHGNYAILGNSSLVNAGSNGYSQGDVDIAGNSRVADNTVDIGAYECPLLKGVVEVSVGDNLQEKVNYSASGSSVRVQVGTFTGNFIMREGVDVSGGWNADFSKLNGTTILDGVNYSQRVLDQKSNFNTHLTEWSNFTLTRGKKGAYLRKNGQLKHCTIVDNKSDDDGGGVQMYNGGNLLSCIIKDNTAGTNEIAKKAGGIRMNGSGESVVANCLIVGNHATDLIGGISIENYDAKVYNNTIVKNWQDNGTTDDDKKKCGVRINNEANKVAFCNNVMWQKMVGSEAQVSQYYKMAETSPAYGSSNNYSNSTGNPGFVNPNEGDYHIKANSQFIDSGNDSYYTGEDLEGKPRKQNHVDKGCYEQTVYTREANIKEGNYGTICLPYAIRAVVGANVYKVISFATDEHKGLLLDEVTTMEAGKPYFFLCDDVTKVYFAYIEDGDPTTAGDENGLYGTLSDLSIGAGEKNYYVLQANELRPVASSITVGKNKAYLDLDEVPNAPAVTPTLSPRRRVIGVYQVPTGMDQISHDQYTNKVLRNGQLLILRDGRTYNALGMEVK